MAKNKKNRIKKEEVLSFYHRQVFKAIFSLCLAIILFLSLFNLAGPVGQFLNSVLKIVFGQVSWLFPFLFLIASALFFSRNFSSITKTRVLVGLFLFCLSFSSFFSLFKTINFSQLEEIKSSGGYLGFFFSFTLKKIFALWGSLTILIALILLSFFFIFEEPVRKKISKILPIIKKIWQKTKERSEKPIVFFKKEIKKTLPLVTESKSLVKIEEEKLPFQFSLFSQRKDKTKKVTLPLDLLDFRQEKAEGGNIERNKIIIQRTLENFGIKVEMGEVKIGPTVTQYTLRPFEGIKLSLIISLQNDLALALAAHPIRIEAPIPGQSLVGIEVPNKKVAILSLREILETDDFKKRETSLTIALGKDVSGHIWLADLGKMPHLLISGATGSGKTVMINTIITTLLFQNSPEDLRFILVDPKRVELVLYNDIPHLLTPVITTIQQTINALKWSLREMERRFDLFSQAKKRDLESYNQEAEEKIPYLVIIIDELADLMVVAPHEVETCIIRLAQMARATGIHLILATQRPSVDIITGLIKANITSRIAFSVASMIDSRTILDFAGAEKLLGRGDMLFTSPQISKPKRLQSAYISDREIKRVVDFFKNKMAPVYEEKIIQEMEKIEETASSLENDELLPLARQTVLQDNRASATLLQRRLRIGYARAARLLDLLEKEGVIGPANGARPRPILKKSIERQKFFSKNEENNHSER